MDAPLTSAVPFCFRIIAARSRVPRPSHAFEEDDGLNGDCAPFADGVETFARLGLDADAVGTDAEHFGEPRAHLLDIGAQPWPLYHDGGVGVDDAVAAFARQP